MREQSLFIMALEKDDPAERAAFLDRACAADPALRLRLLRLLQHHCQADDLLDAPSPWSATLRDRLLGEGAGAVVAGIGTILGPYTLVEEIGDGGMGVVYRAEQTAPVRRRVALKIVKPGMDSRQVIARFEAERQALALMDHPSIAKVLDAGTTETGRPYFVMELVQGVPITQYCDDEGLSLRERLELLIAVCHAVQHAHQKGVIHRDLKPSNVLVTRYDEKAVPKVIDFGVAKATGPRLTDRTMTTQCCQLVGTPQYMSPEQAALNGPDVDTRTDIYALGVLLYELLTGSTPFPKERLREATFDEVLRIIRDEEPPKPSTRLASQSERPGGLIRSDLEWIVMKALEKDRNRRYATANGLAMDLRRYLGDEPVEACPPSVRYRLGKFARRNKGSVIAAGLVVVALIGGIIGTTWGLFRATDARAVALSEAEAKRIALAAAQHSARDATDRLFLALWSQARAGRYSRQMGQRLDSLAALAQAARIRPDECLRDEAIAAMALPDVRRVAGWQSTAPGTSAIAYGSSYRTYARADVPGAISLRTIPGDQEIRRIASGPIVGNYLHFSPDERFLLVLEEGFRLRVWRVADGQEAIRDDLRNCRAHAFSPDGRWLAVGQQDRVRCYDLETGREALGFGVPARVHGLAFRPDNRALAVGYFNANTATVHDAASGKLLAELPVGTMAEQVVAWHPDGVRLAVTGTDPRIQVWNVAARRKVAILEGHVQYVGVLTFHPDGSLLASYGWDGQLLLWNPSSGRLLLRLTSVSTPKFSPDGRWLGVAWHGDSADLLEVTPTCEYRTFVSSAGMGTRSYNTGDISPDGRLLVVGMDEGARVWDLRSGRELAALPARTPYAYFECRQPRVSGPGPSRALLTCGSDGLLRWPITCADPEGRRLSFGPPQPLSDRRRAWFAHGPDGRTLGAVTVEGGSGTILDLQTGEVLRELGIHPRGEVRALSGDGRWAASCGWHSDRVRLWDVASGRMVREWLVGPQTITTFTPDSQALIIARGDEFTFWDVETLQRIRRLRRDVTQYPGWVGFSPVGRLMALEMAPGVLHLKDVITSRTVARLEDPYGDRATWQGFTPDGSRLVVISSYDRAIHVWDLRAIRARLKEMGLDWDWPELPPESPGELADQPVTIEVIPGDRITAAPTRERRAQEDIARWRRAWEASPDSALACNNLAWIELTVPEGLRDVEAALPLAEKAVRLAPGDATFGNTLGVAYYRARRYRDAVEVLQANVARQTDRFLAFDLYFLAMSHHRLGDTAESRAYYEWAVRWVQAQHDLNAGHLEELATFRAEAEELLGIDRKPD